MTPGKTILHYKILEKLGEGGMGVVYKAEDLKLKRFVALKFLHPNLIGQPRTRERMKREARAAASLNHPNICTIYEYHEIEDSVFIVMEYIEGETLKHIIDRDGQLSQEQATNILKQIAEALTVAHNNDVIHRDIKSENIMITKDGQVKVTDFGLAKLKDAPTITKTKSPMGTVGYMSPELVQGEEVDHRTDLWSLGVVLFEMLTGELPFKGDSDVGVMYAIVGDNLPKLTKCTSELSNSIQYICITLLEKDAALRYGKAEDVLKDLNQSVKASTAKLTLRKVRKNYQTILLTTVLGLIVFYFGNYYYQTRINIPPWLKKSATISAIVSNVGDASGCISPDGNYIVYRNPELKLNVKDLANGTINELRGKETGTFHCPIWLADRNQIAYISEERNGISIIDTNDKHFKQIIKHKNGHIFHISASPNGEWISYIWIGIQESEYVGRIYLIRSDGTESRMLLEHKPINGYYLQTAWYPDGKRLAFYDFVGEPKEKAIFSLLIENGEISPPIIKLKNRMVGWAHSGLSYSPDGKYLVFPDFYRDNLELLALPVIQNGTITNGSVIPITKLSGNSIPSYPYFDKKGNQLSFCLLSDNEDIGIASVDMENNKLSEKENLITFYKGMDIDASWSHDSKTIAFISNRDGIEDIYLWSKKDKNISKLNVQSKPKNYKRYVKGFNTINTLRFVPRRNAISYLLKGKLLEFNLNHKKSFEILSIEDIKMNSIYNYAWEKNGNSIFALISELNKLDYGRLIKIDLTTGKIEQIIEDWISLDWWFSITTSPTGNLFAFRHEIENKQRIEIINLKNKKRRILVEHSAQVPTGDISWSRNGKYLLYGEWNDRNNFIVYKIDIETGQRNLLSFRSQGTVKLPGPISPNGDEIIYYTEEFDSDIWLIKGN